MWISEGQVYGKGQGTEEETVTVGHHQGREDFRNTKKKGWEGRRVMDRGPGLTSQMPHE